MYFISWIWVCLVNFAYQMMHNLSMFKLWHISTLLCRVLGVLTVSCKSVVLIAYFFLDSRWMRCCLQLRRRSRTLLWFTWLTSPRFLILTRCTSCMIHPPSCSSSGTSTLWLILAPGTITRSTGRLRINRSSSTLLRLCIAVPEKAGV